MTHPALARRCRALAILPALAMTLSAPLAAQQAGTTAADDRPFLTEEDAWLLGGFAVATVAMFPADRALARELQEHRYQQDVWLQRHSKVLRIIGAPGTLFIGAALYTVGRVGGNERMADLGLHGTEAVVIGAVTTGVLKALGGRARPFVDVTQPNDWQLGRGLRREEYRSFPSGHSTMAFAAAAAVTSEVRRWENEAVWVVGPVMYAGAALIGASRMYNNRHWASDVVMGAAIGTFAGIKVVRYNHDNPDNRLDRWLLGARIAPRPDGSGHTVRLLLVPTFGRFAGR